MRNLLAAELYSMNCGNTTDLIEKTRLLFPAGVLPLDESGRLGDSQARAAARSKLVAQFARDRRPRRNQSRSERRLAPPSHSGANR